MMFGNGDWRIKKEPWGNGWRFVPERRWWFAWCEYVNGLDVTISFQTEQEARDWIQQHLAFKARKSEYIPL